MLCSVVYMAKRNVIGNRLGCGLLVLLLVSCLHSVPAFGTSSSAASHSSLALFQHAAGLSDFDGDNKLDQATLLSNGSAKSIHIAFGKSSWSSLSFDSKVADLISGDIDEDGDVDLVWISQTAGRLVAWLGDGRGNFSAGTNPKLYYDRIQALFGNTSPKWSPSTSGPEPAGVVLGAAFLLPVDLSNQPYPHLRFFFQTRGATIVRLPYLAVPNLRGPPASLL